VNVGPPSKEHHNANVLKWHDDGEMGLGPVITTWTLGGGGTMTFGLKPKYYSGKVTVPKKDDKKDGEEKKEEEEEAEEEEEEKEEEEEEEDAAGGDGDEEDDEEAAPAPKRKGKKVTETTYITDDPVPLGCAKASERLKLLQQLQQLQSGKIDAAQYKAQFAELMKKVTKSGKPKALLEVPLVHGSFVVMHGDRMQEIYEVS
jgi:hypothetical protein